MLLAIVLCSCNDIDQIPDDGEIGAACASDDDCDSGWCLRDPSFPGGYCLQSCDGGDCPGGTTCSDYFTYSWCLDACTVDSACREGYLCNYGVCRPRCNRDDLCHGDDVCVEGRCTGACADDGDCEGGFHCQDGRCRPPCAKDTDCPPGYACEATSGKCQAKPGKKVGEACVAHAECATTFCLPTRKICSAKCNSTTYCPEGFVCGLERDGKLAALAACVPKAGDKFAGESCAADGDCASNHCYYGFCMEGCASDVDCGSLKCVDVQLFLEGGTPAYKGCLPHSGVGQYTIGTFTNHLSLYGFSVPPHASSVVLMTEAESASEIAAIGELTDPAGKVLYSAPQDSCALYSQPNRFFYDDQISSVMIPNTPSVTLVPGIYSYRLGGSQLGMPITVKLVMKLGAPTEGTIDVNWIFLNLADSCIPGDTLNAANAESHPWFTKLRNNLRTILASANLGIGAQTIHDMQAPSLDILNMAAYGPSPELGQLFATSAGFSGLALNIYFVRNIKVSGSGTGGTILGVSGGIPGPPGVHGSHHSGLVMSMETACYEQFGYNPSHTLAHEIGHFLGLFHNQEAETNPGYDPVAKEVLCPCPCGANMSCHTDRWNHKSWCRGEDHLPDTTDTSLNLMYYAAESTKMFEGNQLTPGQIGVMLSNPLVY